MKKKNNLESIFVVFYFSFFALLIFWVILWIVQDMQK